MSLADYMSKERFPLSSQPGLSAEGQLLIDAFNLDSLREGVEFGEPLGEQQRAKLAELEVKETLRPAVYAELREKQQQAGK